MGLNLCILGNFSCFCCRLLTFFKIYFFSKILSVTLSEVHLNIIYAADVKSRHFKIKKILAV